MNAVLDASAMIAFLRNERGAGAVQDQLNAQECHPFAHALNLCEVFTTSLVRPEKRLPMPQSATCLHSE